MIKNAYVTIVASDELTQMHLDELVGRKGLVVEDLSNIAGTYTWQTKETATRQTIQLCCLRCAVCVSIPQHSLSIPKGYG